MISLFWLFLICPLAYLFGSINFAILLTGGKILTKGSGNPGTVNMIRYYGFFMGVLILLLDAIKGALPTLVAMLIWGINTEVGRIAMLSAGLSAIIGHLFPIYYKFKGGKGIATAIGIFCIINPWVSLIAFIAMFVFIIVVEYGFIGTFIFVTTLIVAEGLNPLNHGNIAVCMLLFAMFFLIWFSHRTNIARILIGKENKVTLFKGLKKGKERRMAEKLKKEAELLEQLRMGN
ncbi:MAG: glycerol-3-phosphate acyltransferase [Firmicutes bacterium]|nr:glycerol-3-phosphate acyltransferase [Bacillota bacterium]